MSLVVTGTGGNLGRLVVENLLARGVDPRRIVAGTRDVGALSALAGQGVDVRRIDFDDAASLTAGFAGAEKVLIVSGTDFGRRVEQHVGAARAARDAGAALVAYTSAPYADTTDLQLAAEHRGTEEGIREIGVPFTFLRNGWYFENYTSQIPVWLETGVIVGSAGEGRISAAARSDYAEAAAAVLAGEGHEGAVYELGGDTSFTLPELAEQVATHSGRAVVYRDVTQAELEAVLTGAGVPAPVAAVLADADRAISAGRLLITTGDLARLIGHPTAPLADAVAATVADATASAAS
ncbi:NAD(P)H dehydrogenase (quinone) [Parafrankia irregularis]|uniref:NAD(P)H dehydrogenase (Quinone) n=1 Tax=Parafrankia irregularis TaxID=795642 RepID=A0A0S4QEV2_9ACTN|nr:MULTISPECIES: NmrA family NAD(P)-binding protein [Parafrankia]MBE3203349.1 NmrA family NAD(P)-binding protein [Parafrankia sp. CH37]CUU54003.1 NAD(P)H dehydrogenase (quinone) [Parafrankia irregularis]